MDFTKRRETQTQTYHLFGKERYSRTRSPVNSPRCIEDNLPVLLGTLKMQWQRHLHLCCQVAQVVSNSTTRNLNIGVKNINTAVKLNMAEDIESDSDSSSFDNDDYSDDSDNNHYQKIARDIFGDSDSEENEVFEGFPILMPENVKLDSQEGNLSG